MKKTMILLVMFAAIFCAHHTASAQATYVPTFDNNQSTSLHLGFGQLLYEFDFESTSIDDIEFKQDVTVFGVNWEQSNNLGMLHWRFGLMGLGDTEETSNGSTDTTTDWKDNHLFSFYFGGGYLFMNEIPLTHYGPMSSSNPSLTHKQINDIMFFFGGGFDFNFYAQFAKDENTSGDTDYGFYVFDFAICGIAGVRTPMGFIFHVGISAHLLLDWEYRVSSPLITLNVSDIADLKIPFFGMEAGITYQVPIQPSFRFGLIVKMVNNPMFIMHAGYLF